MDAIIDVLLATSTGFPTKNQGGGTRVIFDILRHINYKEFQCYFISTAFQKRYISPIEEVSHPSDIPVKTKLAVRAFNKMKLYRNIVSSDLYFYLYLKRLNKRLLNASKSFHYNVIHSHDPLALAALCEASSAKKILTIHSKGGSVYERITQELGKNTNRIMINAIANAEEKAIMNADVITFPSHAAKNLFIANNAYPISNENIKIIYNGIDTEFINQKRNFSSTKSKYGITKDFDLVLVNVADHVQQKNIIVLLKAMALLKREYGKNPLLVNIGREGMVTDILLKATGELNIVDNIRFLGNIPNDDVLELMRISDCFILTSYNVVFDLVVLEALACGCAVVVSDEGGNREIIQNGHNGYLVPFDDENEIARIIVQNDLQRVRINARQTAEQFSVKQTIKQYEDLYKEVVNSRK